jgi:glutaminyl-peptide cyclotransferase
VNNLKQLFAITAIIVITTIYSCKDNNTSTDTTTTTTAVKAPAFDANQAYEHIKTQLAFGPRVPGTKAQKDCAAWMQKQLKNSCDTVYLQQTQVTQPVSNKVYPCYNVIGVINPQAASRVLLLCHWDSRGMADQEADKSKHNTPIDAADDGASGVAVLLEIANSIKKQKLDIGVDILMADVEDMGKSEYEKPYVESSFCLGTRYWAKNPHISNYKANYGICLDMVGARNAEFKLEQNSKASAGDFQNKIWQAASSLGYGNYFIYQDGGAITDDHMEVIEHRKIPTVDIINIPSATTTGFAQHWHTLNDNINVIDKNTLMAVGSTVLHVLYNY